MSDLDLNVPPRGDQDPRIADLIDAMRHTAAGIEGFKIDHAAYAAADLPPTTPVLLGSGSLDARVGVLGRDPGRNEIEEREPFIGRGGALVRQAMHRAVFGAEAPDAEARKAVGRRFFWANTVPFKPAGNKAWSVAVKRRFVPHVRTLLTERWAGTDLITFGNVAFDWIRLAWPEHKQAVRAFWAQEDRYEATFVLEMAPGRVVDVRPLPHPSPLNATWYGRLPAMVDARLAECGVGLGFDGQA